MLQFRRIITSTVLYATLVISVTQADQESSVQEFSATAGKLFVIVGQMHASLKENVLRSAALITPVHQTSTLDSISGHAGRWRSTILGRGR